jgi:hypothetical protein
MKKILMSMVLFLMNGYLLCSTDDVVSEIQDEISSQTPKKVVKKEVATGPVRAEQKLFVNYLDNPITILFTDKNNKKFSCIVPSGVTRLVACVIQRMKTVTYFDRHQEKVVTVSLAKLQENSVVIFTLDNKVEFFNFIDIRQKHEKIKETKIALAKARLAIPYNKPLLEKLVKKIEDLDEQTIYRQ